MSNLTLWGANQFARAMFGRSADMPEAYYLALGIGGSPSSFLTGTEITEPDPNHGYTRLYLANDPDTWASDGYQTYYNASQLNYPEATGTWGRMNYWALCNAPEDGEVYLYGRFTSNIVIYAGNMPIISAGMLRFSMNLGTSLNL